MRRILILLILFSSCKSTHTTTTDTTKDTVMVNRTLTITPATLNEIIIEDVCDSLGNVRPISYISTSGKAKTVVKSHQNTLKIEVNIDSIKQVAVDTYKSTLKDKSEVKIITKRYIPKWVWYSLLANILFILYKFRRFIW